MTSCSGNSAERQTLIEHALARLQLGMSVEDLAQAAGDEWVEPGPRNEGRYSLKRWGGGVGPDLPFAARVTASGMIGSLGYYGSFPGDIEFHGLRIGMPFDEVEANYPGLVRDPVEGSEKHGIDCYTARTANGDHVSLRLRSGVLLAAHFERPGQVYPADALRNRYARDPNARAYDVSILAEPTDRADAHGWCFGLPPGITPDQWPLDARTGHPMRHAFTLLLPEAYRRKGPELVAICMFDGDWSGQSVPGNAAVASVWPPDAAEPDDAELLAVWRHRQNTHAHEHRFEDELGEPYAAIWLTQDEFDASLCQPPLRRNLNPEGLPLWADKGSAAAFVEREIGTNLKHPPEWYFVVRQIGGLPAQGLDVHRALRWTERANDPNAGVPPPEGDLFEQVSEQGYQSIWSEKTDEKGLPLLHDWARDLGRNHIGGTMQPFQAHPSASFSPYYLGFGEELGGFNFGGGTAQLDLETMRIDWAC
jgi:hypothetical protein